MNGRLTTIVTVLLIAAAAGAKYTRKSKAPPKPPPDICKDAIDPYRPSIQKARFFRAAGADNELTEAEFNADKARPNAFARRFDSWRAIACFDKDRNKSIDWLEADAYRYSVRRRILDAYDANADGKLSGDERARANTYLARGRVPPPPKSTHAYHKARNGATADHEAERARLKAQLDAIRKKIYYSPAIAKLREACAAAERAYEKAKEAPGIVEVRKPYDAARRAYEKARENTPEAKLYEKVKKAYYDAYHNMPEYKAYRAAREALKSGGNRAAYERAKSSYEARRLKIPEYADYKIAREAREKAAAATGEYKDLQDAEKAYREVYERILTRERKVRDDARKARDARVDQLFKADPTARIIYSRLKKLEAKHK